MWESQSYPKLFSATKMKVCSNYYTYTLLINLCQSMTSVLLLIPLVTDKFKILFPRGITKHYKSTAV